MLSEDEKKELIKKAEEYYAQCRREQMRARIKGWDIDNPQEYAEIKRETKVAFRKLEELRNVEVPIGEEGVSAEEKEE